MKASKTYLKGKSIFIVSIIVICLTIITVYFTGENYGRTITQNFNISLSIIGFSLFLFMTYGLYVGIGLKNDFPEMKGYSAGELFTNLDTGFSLPDFDADDLGGILLSIIFWIAFTLSIIIFLLLVEILFFLTVFIVSTILYWLFFRALKVVFAKSSETKGNLISSMAYSLFYTALYTGWLFAIVYIVDIVK